MKCHDCGRIISEDDAIVLNEDTENEIIFCSDCAEFDLFESLYNK